MRRRTVVNPELGERETLPQSSVLVSLCEQPWCVHKVFSSEVLCDFLGVSWEPASESQLTLFQRAISPAPSSMIGLNLLFSWRSFIRASNRWIQLTRSVTRSSSCSWFKVFQTSSMALPRMVGSRLPMVAWMLARLGDEVSETYVGERVLMVSSVYGSV
jgi:hypothetical protein